ncbi:unnamed protein product [Allacma fusca]|uniref:Uncharacterized protein n=1 Tax=Allacma fusca TaxID=39272 RepID=A0A8J2LF64_9HEXA|nr:unnamed protein product [Allacma fusca]
MERVEGKRIGFIMQSTSVPDAGGAGMPSGIPSTNMMGVPAMTPLPSIPAPQIMNPEGAQQFCLRWNSYPATVATQLAALRATEDFVDVTLACDGRQLKAHKLVLSACSPYFMQLLKSTPCQHPVIFLRDVGFRQLVALLEFMYAGEVNVSQVELPALLRTAESLQVRGLADTTANNNNNSTCAPQQKPAFSPSYGQTVGAPVMTNTPPAPIPADPPTCSEPSPADPVAAPTPPKQSRREERSVTSGGERQAEDEENSSDSNESHEEFETVDQDMKPYLPDESAPEQVDQPVDSFDGGEIDEPEVDSLNVNQTNVGSSVAGSQSEEETSEEEDDDDDGEYKDISYQFDPSYKQESLPDLDGSANGENVPGPSGVGGQLPDGDGSGGGGSGKEDGGNGGTGGGGSGSGSARNRLSRSLWPPGIPYHGPQQCPYCPRVLSNVGNWRKHVLTMHFAREKVYKCNHCASAFRTAEYLQKHYKIWLFFSIPENTRQGSYKIGSHPCIASRGNRSKLLPRWIVCSQWRF